MEKLVLMASSSYYIICTNERKSKGIEDLGFDAYSLLRVYCFWSTLQLCPDAESIAATTISSPDCSFL